MPQYKTKDLYEGCHPVIAEHLKRGEAIWCKVWDGDCRLYTMSGFVKQYNYDSTSMAYLVNGTWYEHAEPIHQKQKVRRYKKASEIIRWFEKNGGYHENGTWGCVDQEVPNFVQSMVEYCGCEASARGDSWKWHPDWIEEVEE